METYSARLTSCKFPIHAERSESTEGNHAPLPIAYGRSGTTPAEECASFAVAVGCALAARSSGSDFLSSCSRVPNCYDSEARSDSTERCPELLHVKQAPKSVSRFSQGLRAQPTWPAVALSAANALIVAARAVSAFACSAPTVAVSRNSPVGACIPSHFPAGARVYLARA